MRAATISQTEPIVTLDAKVAFLGTPEAYPDRPAHVEAIETHMSWVFLTDRYAYKLKKPVHRSFLDFSTIDARHRNCMEEVRLNRRLAPRIYLGVVPLTIDPAGRMHLNGDGPPIDWLVHMVRLMLPTRWRSQPPGLKGIGNWGTGTVPAFWFMRKGDKPIRVPRHLVPPCQQHFRESIARAHFCRALQVRSNQTCWHFRYR